jgi:hypothetical protein
MAYQKLQAGRAAAVTPSNDVIVAPNGTTNNDGCVLYVGGAGTLNVQTVGGDDVSFVGVLAGTFIPVNVLKVYASSTASNIVALW